MSFLRSLTKDATASQKRSRHLNRLAEFDFRIQPIPGVKNVLADYCSRYCDEVKNRVFAVTEKKQKKAFVRQKNKWQLRRDRLEALRKKKEARRLNDRTYLQRPRELRSIPEAEEHKHNNLLERKENEKDKNNKKNIFIDPTDRNDNVEMEKENDNVNGKVKDIDNNHNSIANHPHQKVKGNGNENENAKYENEMEMQQTQHNDINGENNKISAESALEGQHNSVRRVGQNSKFFVGEEFEDDEREADAGDITTISIDWHRTSDEFSQQQLLKGQRMDNIISILIRLLQIKSKDKEKERNALLKELPTDVQRLCRGEFFQLKGQLVSTKLGQLVVPKTLRAYVLNAAHEQSVHIGQKRTMDRVASKYWWPGMSKDVVSWVRTCEACQFGRAKNTKTKAKMRLWPAQRFNEVLHIDIWGPYQRTQRGNRFIIGMKDRFSRYIALIPTPNQKAATVAKVLRQWWFSRFGAPESLMSDCGANLVGKVVREVCERYGIRMKNTTPYFPEGNGSMERVFRFMGEALRIQNVAQFGPQSKYSKMWDLHCFDVADVYNGTRSRAVGVMPDELANPTMEFQRQIWDDMMAEDELRTEKERVLEYQAKLTDFVGVKRLAAQRKQRWYDRKRKEYFDRNKSDKMMAVGDEVLRYEGIRRLHQNKLQSFFSGPWKVIERKGNAMRIAMIGEEAMTETVNVKWLQPFERRSSWHGTRQSKGKDAK